MGETRGTTTEKRIKKPFWTGLGSQVVIGMILGALLGIIAPEVATSMKMLGDIFLRLIKTAVGPLVFLTVTAGIAAAGDFKRVGRIGLIAMLYFEVVSTIAIVYGFAAAYISGVGYGVHHVASAESTKAAMAAAHLGEQSHTSLATFFVNIFPESFVGAFAEGHLLQILVIAIIFGAGLLALPADKRMPIERGLTTLSNGFFKFIDIIMKLAPIGTFGAVAYAVGSNGTEVLYALIWLVLAFYIAVVVFVLVVFGGVCMLFKLNLFDLLRYIKDELIIVFGTASSESVLPKLLEKLPKYGISKQTVGLVMPTGYAFNLDGSSIFMSLAVVFISHVYNMPMTWTQIGTLMVIMLLTSKGAATVSGGAFMVLAATVTASGFLPIEGLALVFGVYRFMSIAVAALNAFGNCLATVVTAKICGDFDPEQAKRALAEVKAAEQTQ